MRRTRFSKSRVEAAIGYAADAQGRGVAYARLTGTNGERLLRVPFRVGRPMQLPEREPGYAALTALTQALRRWGIERVAFALDDAELIEDLAGARELPPPIVLPYVRLRCALNQLDDFSLSLAGESDLAQRARAEVALNVAA